MPSVTSKPPRSLLKRLRLFFLLSMAASALLVLLVFTLLGDRYGRQVLAQKAELFAEVLAEHLVFDGQGRAIGFDTAAVPPWILSSLAPEMQVRVLDGDGRVHISNGERRSLVPASHAPLPQALSLDILHGGVDMHLATRTVLHQGQTWVVQLAASERLISFLRETFGEPGVRRGVLAVSAVFLVVFLVSFQWTLRRSLLPLHDASAAAQRISPDALGKRLDADAQPAEIQPLVKAFNQALDRLQRGFEAQQQFLASAAHELKTPLALIRAQVELGTPAPDRAELLGDIDRMARQVQQLLLLAETSEPLNYELSVIDPRPILEEACSVMARVADRRAVLLQLQVADGVSTWRADRGALFTLMRNLLENAIQHSAAGDVVCLHAHAGGFEVSDQGPGISAQDMPHMFDRFWRGAHRRDDGAGLGLSICAAIAAAHGWEIVPCPRERGLRMEVRMEVAAGTSSA